MAPLLLLSGGHRPRQPRSVLWLPFDVIANASHAAAIRTTSRLQRTEVALAWQVLRVARFHLSPFLMFVIL